MIQKVENKKELSIWSSDLCASLSSKEEPKKFTPNKSPEALEYYNREIQLGKPKVKKENDTETANNQ